MCEGKCYLKKTIEEKHRDNTESPIKLEKNKVNITYYFSDNLLATILSNNTEFTKQIYFVLSQYSFSFFKKVFRPPGLL